MISNPDQKSWSPPSLGLLLDVLLPILLALFLLPFLHPRVNLPIWDEFILLCEGTRLLDGQAPGADYFTFLPAGNSLFFAGLFSLFGNSLTAARAATFTAIIFSSLGVARLGKQLNLADFPRWGVALFLPAVCLPIWPISSHHWLALLAIPWTLLALHKWQKTGSKNQLLGVWVGLAWTAMLLQTHWAILGAGVGALLVFSSPSPARVAKGLAFVLSSQLPQFSASALMGGGSSLGQVFYNQWIWIFSGYGQQGGVNQQTLADLLSSSSRWVFGEEGFLGMIYRADLTLLLWFSPVAPLILLFALPKIKNQPEGERAPESPERVGWLTWVTSRSWPLALTSMGLMALYTFWRAPSIIHLCQYALPMMLGPALLFLATFNARKIGLALFLIALFNLGFWSLPVYQSGFQLQHLTQSRTILETYPPWQMISRSPYRDLKEPILVLPEGAQFQFMGFINPTPFNLVFEEHLAYYTKSQKQALVDSLEHSPPVAIILYPKSRASGFLSLKTGTGQFIAKNYRKAGENNYLMVFERIASATPTNPQPPAPK